VIGSEKDMSDNTELGKLDATIMNANYTTQMVQERLRELNHIFKEDANEECLKKGEDLLAKASRNEYAIGFCGHFSAGKSTLINELLGETILPSHPIPTSANIVKIHHGPPFVKVLLKEKGLLTLENPNDLTQIQSYCRDGDSVTEIEISNPNANLPEGVAFIDTPGIDSTDDAHRVATESSLHLVDSIVYMMDYHHVQSEVNFSFLKQITTSNKDCIIVVNQIDKHLETEIPFFVFREQVHQSLVDHNISFNELLFVSGKVHNARFNELDQLKSCLETYITSKEKRALLNIVKEAFMLIEQHKKWLKKQYNKELTEYGEILTPHQLEDEAELRKSLKATKEKLIPLDDLQEHFEIEFEEKLKTILQNANLMPYHTRNLARDFLESEQLSFKLNGLFSRKKTRAEKEKRKTEFFNEVKENARTYLDIHIKDLLFKHMEAYEIDDEAVQLSIHRFEGNLEPDIITNLLKRGALFSHEYVLNYCQSVIESVHAHYKKAARAQLEEAIKALRKREGSQQKSQIRKRDELERKLAAISGIKNIYNNVETRVNSLRELLRHSISQTIMENESHLLQSSSSFTFTKGREVSVQPKKWTVNIGELFTNENKEKQVDLNLLNEKRQQTADSLVEIAAHIEKYKGLHSYSLDLGERADRLRNQKFIVTLFGAFSAGKSSFANALIGENILPVSPSPTTAAINQILPPTQEHPHETVIVNFKQEKDLLQDINDALSPSEMSVERISELFQLLSKREEILKGIAEKEKVDNDNTESNEQKKEENRDPLELLDKGQIALLKAIQLGYGEMNALINQEKKVSITEFQRLVATEQHACFIEKINLYYDCPITRQGIILVDTPGADSIHRRHTELAFNYIKESDAVLFVTYYNHAFSKADREFLIQLGRIKDCFTNDKMFFIVNAADLAENAEEVQHVLTHVEKELLRCGIRYPSIFPVSSQLAMYAKRYIRGACTQEQKQLYESKIPEPSRKNGVSYSGLAAFEEALHRFTLNDLTRLSIQSSIHDLSMITRIMDSWLHAADIDESERVKRLNEAFIKKEQAVETIRTSQDDIEEKLVLQEIHELLYYVKQRVFYRYFDEFKDIFTFSRFREGDFHATLRKCLSEIIQFIAYDLTQEMRASSFRIEVFLKKQLKEKHRRLTGTIEKEVHQTFFMPYSEPTIDLLSFSEEMHDFSFGQYEQLLERYQNMKDSFIVKGNRVLRDELEEKLRGPVDKYIKNQREKIELHYYSLFQKEMLKLKESLLIQAEDFFKGEITALSVEIDNNDLKNTHAFIHRKLQDLNSHVY